MRPGKIHHTRTRARRYRLEARLPSGAPWCKHFGRYEQLWAWLLAQPALTHIQIYDLEGRLMPGSTREP